MGACGSSMTAEEKAQAALSNQIDTTNRKDNDKELSKIKLLLLGAGESGKSTIFKQLRILYGQGYNQQTPEELNRWKSTVYNNVLSNMKVVLENVDSFADESLKEKVDGFLALPMGAEADIDGDCGELMKAFWADDGVQEAWERRADYQVQDSLVYYMSEIDRIAADDFKPNEQDILRTRVRTSGIVEEHYMIDGVEFVLFDVGGQRNERKKWIHCFDNVTAVIFVAAINEYNQVLYEDQTMNRMDEAVILFDEICNSPYFKDTSMILFLNKRDLFVDKLAHVPFRVDSGPHVRYTDYDGPVIDFNGPSGKPGSPEFLEVQHAIEHYILQLFLNRNRNKRKEVYHHVTEATDTENVSVVFNASKDIILQRNLSASGFAAAAAAAAAAEEENRRVAVGRRRAAQAIDLSPRHRRARSDKMLASRVLLQAAVKRTTGLVGLEVVPDARDKLADIYAHTLEKLKELPAEAPYRQSIEAITKHRLMVVQKHEDVAAIEKEIECGQVEELLVDAQEELKLMEHIKDSAFLRATMEPREDWNPDD
ncbi:Guanine nucleotide-binding protein G(o) subunit alpha [Durusdinium trenchii]|uniref:Guanine nucleotide-binding protein G(O) subunit alpha n=1 Tax=Durusdinium trenchii TaxID=1381693 RepID=A0ABP0KHZ0_9DINO